jgi:glycosyltransferase involved in cell wall biosynthesis
MQCSAVSVIIPAYNEEKTISNVISNTISIMNNLLLPYEIIVINDGSTDQTGLIASKHKATVLSNEKNRGKGYSIRKALQHAQGDIIVTIDSDGEHNPKEIPELINPLLKGADIVIGSRFMTNNTHATTKLNLIGNFIFNTTIFALTGKGITDSQTGFRAIKRNVLKKLTLESNGYEIETEITVKGLRNGFLYKERPITCERRVHSISKLQLVKDSIRILKTVLKARLTKISHNSDSTE